MTSFTKPKISLRDIYNSPDKLINWLINLNLNPTRYSFIYGIYNIILDKWYIGQTKNILSRLYSSWNGDGHFQLYDSNSNKCKIKGNLVDNFLVILEFLDKDSEVYDLDSIETKYIELMDSYLNGFNLDRTGQGYGFHNLDKYLYHNPECTIQKYYYEGEQPSDWIQGSIPGTIGGLTSDNFIGSTKGLTLYHDPDCLEGHFFLEGTQPKGWIKGRKVRETYNVFSYIYNDRFKWTPLTIFMEIYDNPNCELKWGSPTNLRWNDECYKSLPVITLKEIFGYLSDFDKQYLLKNGYKLDEVK